VPIIGGIFQMMHLPLIDRQYHRATTVSDALLAKREMGREAVYLGGGTALQLGWSDGQVPPPLIDVAALRRPSPSELDQDYLHLCAFTPLEAFRADLLVRREFNALSMALETIASFEVRGLGTLGGNVTWTKGDLRPLMLAVAAEAMTSDGVIPFARWIEHQDPDTLLLSMRVPRASSGVVFEKVGFRAAFSPSCVTLSYCVRDGRACVAVGGGENRVGRLRRVEDALSSGQPPTVVALKEMISDEGVLADDAACSAEIRAEMAARILFNARWDLERRKAGAR
jgi:CO/xanthine dehydrogenase FAD-binding subunit